MNPPSASGSLAEETARLLEALRSLGVPGDPGGPGGVGEAGGVGDAADAYVQHTGPECRVCPFCRGLAALRQVRPEAVERLVVAATELAVAVRDVLTPSAGGAGGTGAGGPGGAGPDPRTAGVPPGHAGTAGFRPAAEPVVQRIDVGD